MESHVDVEQIITRTRQYEFADGLRDMQLALMWAAYGAMTWFVFDMGSVWLPAVWGLAARFGRWAGMSTVLLTLIPALLVLAALAVMNLVRRHWLWRKTGTVKPHPILVPRKTNLISATILLAGLAVAFGLMLAGVVDSFFALKALFAMSGVSFGYTLIAMSRSLPLPRYTWQGWLGGVLSLPLLAAPLTLGQFGLILGGMWALVMVAGGIPPLIDTARAARESGPENGDE